MGGRVSERCVIGRVRGWARGVCVKYDVLKRV